MSEYHTASKCRNCDGKGHALIYHFDWLHTLVTWPEDKPYPPGIGIPQSAVVPCNCDTGTEIAARSKAEKKVDGKGNVEFSYKYDKESNAYLRTFVFGEKWYHIRFDSDVSINDVLTKFAEAIEGIEDAGERNYYAQKFGFAKEPESV